MPEKQRASMDLASAQPMGKQAQSQTDYALQMYRYVVEREGVDRNAVLSPSGIGTALAMTAAGSEGPTLDQFVAHLRHKDAAAMHQFHQYVQNVIFRDGRSSGGPTMGIANGLWVDEKTPFNSDFAKYVKIGYGAEAQETDFRLKAGELVKDVNDWVRDRTSGKSGGILGLGAEALYSYTRLLVVNAFYFKGAWKEKFDAKLTVPKTFHLLDGGTVSVPMMRSSRKQLIKCYSNWVSHSDNSGSFTQEDPWSFDGHAQTATVSPKSSAEAPFDFKVVKLPYRSAGLKDARCFSMYVLLPDKRGGLEELERDLSAEWLTRELPLITRAEPVGDFFLPRFKAAFNCALNGPLQSAGLTLPFSERKADFSAMLDEEASRGGADKRQPGCFCYGMGRKPRPLALSSMVHEAVVEVNEDGGTEAAIMGARVAGLTRYNSLEPLYKLDFVADHPFLYVIREDSTGLLLFVGRVANPKQGEAPLLDL